VKKDAQSPADVVAKLFEAFVVAETREEKIAEALKELVARQKFDEFGRMSGPKLNVKAVAMKAGVSRELVSHEGCDLPGARNLILQVLRLLSEYSYEVECEFLRQEVNHLRARVDRQDSILANRVVALHKDKTKIEPTPKGKYSASDVRRAAQIVPMKDL
jgi:DNA-directed RNA polymerase beta' subunit